MISSSRHTRYDQTKAGHITRYFVKAKRRAKDKQVPFDLDLEYLRAIATDSCPIFGIKFKWGQRQGPRHRYTPSLDRIVPELGYVRGNVVFISMWANMIKADATEKELYKVADWLHDARKEVLKNAKKNSAPSVSNQIDRSGETVAESRTVHGAGAGQDSDGPDDYLGATQGPNTYRSTKEGS